MTSWVPYNTSILKALSGGSSQAIWMGLGSSIGFGAGMVVTALRVTSLWVHLPDLKVSGRGPARRSVLLAVRNWRL